MPTIPNSVRVGGFIAPSFTSDPYATHDDAYGMGGFRPVADTTERDLISPERRKPGMWVYSIADAKTYTLEGGITNGDWVEVSMGGAVVAPEFSLVSPRAIASADHNAQLLAAASVEGGFIFLIDNLIAPGTTVRIGCLGLTLKVICGPNTIIMGVGPFAAGIVGLGFGDAGTYIDLIYVGEILEGTYAWSIVGGSGVVTEVDGGGEFTSLRYIFDAIIPDSVAGNILTVDANLQVADSGTAIADLQAAYVTTLGALAIDLIDDTDFVAVEAAPYITEGMGYVVEVTPTTATGNLTVVFYQDVARLEAVFTLIVDLSDADTYRSAEPFGFALETTGTLYATAFVSGVGMGETFDLTLKAVGLLPVAPPAPLPGPYGRGLEDDGLGKAQVKTASDGGIGFDGTDAVVVLPDITAPVYPTLSAAGVAITGAVDTTTDEVVAAKKLFDAVGCTPLVGSGPPAAGTYATGHEVLDVNNVKWRCVSGGTPGDWELADSVAETQADYYTAALDPGVTETLEILTTGDSGIFPLLQVWAVVNATADYSTDFRLRIYRTADGYGRDVLWQASGIARQSYLTAILPAAQDYIEVNDEDMFETDEACVIYETDNRYELARILARSTGNMDLDEVLVDASSWAADTKVCGVAEFENVPFRNEDGTPANRGRAFLQVRNNHATNTAVFYVRAVPLSLGVLR